MTHDTEPQTELDRVKERLRRDLTKQVDNYDANRRLGKKVNQSAEDHIARTKEILASDELLTAAARKKIERAKQPQARRPSRRRAPYRW